ncbi:hypothetical protein KKC60_04570, partial [Patescibacteria group bacterium]|nr:hypothetical protein [Patescibacteria group bacterium]
DLPAEVQQILADKQNTPAGLGQNTAEMISDVGAESTPLVKKYPDRYEFLAEIAEKGLSPRKAYNLMAFMGQDYFKGYDDMDSIDKLTFPKDHSAHEDFPFGWYFFSGNFKDKNDNVVDVVVVFFRRAIYPPPIAEKLGLSQLDNQTVETVVAVNYADKNLHILGSDPLVSGASGLVTFDADPLLMQVGKNKAVSLQQDALFPMKLEIEDPAKDFKIDLTLKEGKPVLYQGEGGKAPSIYGLGTWYYSIPNIKTEGSVVYEGETREITGKMWMDNQWMAGITPPGYPNNAYIQALSNISNGFKKETPKAWGWDWSDVQFDDNTEITYSSIHSTLTKDLNNLGDTPPGNVERETSGKYIHEDGTYEDIKGNLTITKWNRSPHSKAWYPDGWDVKFPDQNIEFTMVPTVEDQFIFSSNSEIREGGTIVKGKKDGKDIAGYGFGEGVGYSGQEYTYKKTFELYGLEDTEKNRDLLTAKPPGTMLVFQSLMVVASPGALLILLIMIVVDVVRKKKHRR